jgi:hypothetical protein
MLDLREPKRCLFFVTDGWSAALAPLITTVMLAACLYILFSSRFGPKDKPWGYAILGGLIGFWLH